MRSLLTFLLLFTLSVSNAQGESDFWYFGDGAGLDFSTTPPTALSNSAMNAPSGCSTVSDSSGNLLFYTDGNFVWNRNHTLMNPSSSTSPPGPGEFSWGEQVLIIKDPDSSTKYFIIYSISQFRAHSIRYRIVDMSLNNGLGQMVQLTNPSWNQELITVAHKKAAAHVSTNSNPSWVVLCNYNYPNLQFFSLKIENNIINKTNIVASSFQDFQYFLAESTGILKFSPDGSEIVLTAGGDAALFQFDNSSGVISNLTELSNNQNYVKFYGAEFSADGSILYLNGNTDFSSISCITTNQSAILQYDLSKPAGWNSNPIVLNNSILSDVSHSELQLAPDGKIYVSKNCEPSLSAINNPNILGHGANFVADAITLSSGTTSRIGLPYLVTGSDATASISEVSTLDVHAYPNPSKGLLNISSNLPIEEISILDINGKLMKRLKLSGVYTIERLDISYLKTGLYFLKINSAQNSMVRKVVVE